MDTLAERLSRLKADHFPPLYGHNNEINKNGTGEGDASGNTKNSETFKMDFVKTVGRSGTTDLQFFPLEDKTQATVSMPLELVKEVAKSYSSVLYGYFLGPRIHFPIVERFLKTVWGKFGFCEAMMNDNGIFFFRFNDEGGCNQVIEMGPTMIKGIPLFVFKWDPTKGLSKPEHTTCPLWVKLHNIPLVAFNREGVSRISSVLGVPKQMDACTANMCDKTWGRPGFAKVLVDVWAVGEFKRKLEVIVPDLKGGQEVKVSIDVEYLWEPSQCSHCCVFGHKSTSCVKAPHPTQRKKEDGKDGNGYIQVEKRQWKPKIQTRPQEQIPVIVMEVENSSRVETSGKNTSQQSEKDKAGIAQEKRKEQREHNRVPSLKVTSPAPLNRSVSKPASNDISQPSTSNTFGLLGNMTGEEDNLEVLMSGKRMEQQDTNTKNHQ